MLRILVLLREEKTMTKAKRIGITVLAAVMLGLIAFSITSRFSVSASEAIEAEDMSLKGAKSALLMDYHTGTVVFEKDPLERMPIASMVKIMTLNIIFDEIAAGNVSLETEITAGANATAMGGSQAFLDTNDVYNLSDLIQTIVVASANDACVAVAEHISGSVHDFVARMNEKAALLGMNDTNFANCTGLPAVGAYSCAKDVGIMTKELLKHDGFYNYSKIWMYDLLHPSGRTTALSNTNKLLRAYEGCDGGKTGFTNEAMYCLSATAKRGNTRLISVVMGANTSKERNAMNAKLFNYGFANYDTRALVLKGQTGAAEAVAVERGKESAVGIVPNNDLYYFGKKGKLDISFESTAANLRAPVTEQQEVGELIVKVNGEEVGRVGLVTVGSVAKKTYLDTINDVVGAW